MEQRRKFISAINKLLKTADLVKLQKSCNSQDQEYAQEVLRKMHQAFVDTYGTDCVRDEAIDLIELPAVIRGRTSGDVYLGLVTVDVESSGEHYNTVFFMENGIVDTANLTHRKSRLREEFLKSLGRYDYWYTPEIPRDIHVNFHQIPHRVEELLKCCVGMEPTQQMAAMDGIR